MDEKRKLPRWEVNKVAKVWLSQAKDHCHCMIEDMHLKGMRVSFSDHLLQQGSVSMSFAIGNNFAPIKIEAWIPWAKEEQGRYVYGLSFRSISEQDKERIYQFLNARYYEQFRDKWWAE